MFNGDKILFLKCLQFDQNKIPVLAKAKVLVGSIKMELINYEGVNHPLARK